MRPTFLVGSTEHIRSYRKSNPHTVRTGEDLLWLEWQLVSEIACSENKYLANILVHAQELHNYHHEACLSSMRMKPNIGLALTRMACELSRDVIIMAGDLASQELWWNREDRNSAYKKIFRFDRINSPIGSTMHDLYKIGSQFGVHGHINPLDMKSFPIKHNNRVIQSKINPGFIDSCIDLSLVAIQSYIISFVEHNAQFMAVSVKEGSQRRFRQLASDASEIDIRFRLKNIERELLN